MAANGKFQAQNRPNRPKGTGLDGKSVRRMDLYMELVNDIGITLTCRWPSCYRQNFHIPGGDVQQHLNAKKRRSGKHKGSHNPKQSSAGKSVDGIRSI